MTGILIDRAHHRPHLHQVRAADGAGAVLDKVVISPRDGVPHLMFRMANWRRNRIVEAQLRVILLVTERTREGEMLRRQIDLPLVRDQDGVFFLTWTAMHLIDETSPFYGPDALARLRASRRRSS